MINDNTILSSFDDRPTLLEWLKKVEDALKTDTATAVSVENPSANTYVFKITFADGTTLSSGNVVFPDSVKDVSIKNGHIIVTQVGGTQTDLGVLNPYADTIVENAETNTTEIGNNVAVGGDLSVNGSVVGRGIVTSIGRLTANGGIEVNGQGYVNGTLGVTGNATIGGTITSGGKAINAVEANPTGEATQTLEKVKIGDVAYNVGGGSDYTAGSNIEISTAKEIAVKSNLTGLNSIKLKGDYGDATITGYNEGGLKIKSNANFNTLPKIYLEPRDMNAIRRMTLTFINEAKAYQTITFDTSGTNESAYAFLTIGSKVPFVPSGDGTYILKAHVSSGTITYSWELQQ